MTFVVQWVPIGPEMSVSLATPEDVLELTNELASRGGALNIRVMQDGEPVKLKALEATREPSS